jgi:hypothetical protein
MTEDFFKIYQTGPLDKSVSDSVKNVDYAGFKIRYILGKRGKIIPINFGTIIVK